MAETRTADETREIILVTAERLLRRYGVSKLTVVDIARACGMSHANVYRFFDTKAAIIDAITGQWLTEAETVLRRAITGKESAAEQFEAYVVELHRLKMRKLAEDPEGYEAYDAVAREARAVFDRYRCVLSDILVSIVQHGVERGEFLVEDVPAAVSALRDATLRFHHPVLVVTECGGKIEQTETQARRVVRLLVAGLRAGVI